MKDQHKSLKTAYEEAKAAYLECQKALQDAHDQKARLDKQRAATLQTAKDAGEAWKAKFKESNGQLSDAIRKLKAKEIDSLEEVRLLDELISEQKSALDDAQKKTTDARRAYVSSAEIYRYEDAKFHLSEAAAELFATKAASEFLKSLAVRLDYAMSEILGDAGSMSKLGFVDLHQNNKSLLARVTNEDRKLIDIEVKKRKKEIVFELLDKQLKDIDKPEGAVLESVSRLACEQDWKGVSPAAAHFQGVSNAKA